MQMRCNSMRPTVPMGQRCEDQTSHSLPTDLHQRCVRALQHHDEAVHPSLASSSSSFFLAWLFFFLGFADLARSFFISSSCTAKVEAACFSGRGSPVIFFVPPGSKRSVNL